MLPAMALDSILYVDIVEGSYNMASFAAFIGALLNQMKPFPEPKSLWTTAVFTNLLTFLI